MNLSHLYKHIGTVGHIVLIFNTMCPTVPMCLYH